MDEQKNVLVGLQHEVVKLQSRFRFLLVICAFEFIAGIALAIYGQIQLFFWTCILLIASWAYLIKTDKNLNRLYAAIVIIECKIKNGL